MDMTGERRIPASRARVWEALNDPEVLRSSIPGCQTLERVGENELQATAAVKIGPIAARFTGRVHLLDLDPPSSYRIEGEGQGGVAGFAKGGAVVRLADDGADTLLTYDVKAQVGGKIAQLGARLIDATAKQMADAFFNNFSAAVVAGEANGTDAAAIEPLHPSAAPGDPVRPVGVLGATAAGAAPVVDVAAIEPLVASAAPGNPVRPVEVLGAASPTGPDSIVRRNTPPMAPPAAISVLSLIPSEIFGLPIVAWIGIVVYLPILFLLLSTYL